MTTIGKRIKQLRELNHLTQEELGKKINTTKQTIFKYENEIITNIPTSKIQAIADLFGVTPSYLMGWEDKEPAKADISDLFQYDNIFPLPKTKKVPLVGTIACGTPILADENIEAYIEVPLEYNVDFCLKCKGDSMINARIFDGDIVYIKKQEDVDNGEVAAVLIGEEATLKKVFKSKDKLTLRAENPLWPDMIYQNEELDEIRILGKALLFLSKVR